MAGFHTQSPAAQSGIVVGDVLVRMGEIDQSVSIGTQDQYWMTLEAFAPGQCVVYTVLRWNASSLEYDELSFEVEIQTPPEPTSDDVDVNDMGNVFGMCRVGELQPALGVEWGMNASASGVIMRNVPWDSYAARCGLLTGDLLLEIDGCKIESVEQMETFKLNRSDRHHLVIQRADMVGEITI